MSKSPDLSIIIPAYQEAKWLANSLETLAAFLKTRNYGLVEVVVVVPDSPDGTAKIARSKADLFQKLKVVDVGVRMGKGRDVRIGMFESSGRYKLFMDADLATPLRHLDDVFRLMERGEKVGIAVRDLVSIHKGLLRKVVTKLANLAAQIILLPGIKDTQCGFKVFEAKAAQAIFSRQTLLEWSFDVEILLIARKLGYKINYIEANDWQDPKGAGEGLVGDSPLKIVFSEAGTLFKVRWNAWTGVYRRPHYQHKSYKS